MSTVAACAAELPDPDDSNFIVSPNLSFICEHRSVRPADLGTLAPDWAKPDTVTIVRISTAGGEVVATFLEDQPKGCHRSWRFVDDHILLVKETNSPLARIGPPERIWRLNLLERTFTSSTDSRPRPLGELQQSFRDAREGLTRENLQDLRGGRAIAILGTFIFGLSLLVVTLIPGPADGRMVPLLSALALLVLSIRLLWKRHGQVSRLEAIDQASGGGTA